MKKRKVKEKKIKEIYIHGNMRLNLKKKYININGRRWNGT